MRKEMAALHNRITEVLVSGVKFSNALIILLPDPEKTCRLARGERESNQFDIEELSVSLCNTPGERIA